MICYVIVIELLNIRLYIYIYHISVFIISCLDCLDSAHGLPSRGITKSLSLKLSSKCFQVSAWNSSFALWVTHTSGTGEIQTPAILWLLARIFPEFLSFEESNLVLQVLHSLLQLSQLSLMFRLVVGQLSWNTATFCGKAEGVSCFIEVAFCRGDRCEQNGETCSAQRLH